MEQPNLSQAKESASVFAELIINNTVKLTSKSSYFVFDGDLIEQDIYFIDDMKINIMVGSQIKQIIKERLEA
jgi:hypothetical protein